MTMKKTFNVWINKEFRSIYSDFPKNGLRLFFHGDIPEQIKVEIKKYVWFLRKLYWFPIQCKIHVCNKEKFTSIDRKHFNYGMFLYDDKTLPEIYLPILEKKEKVESCKLINYQLTRLITYYFQWYFNEDKERSNRSLEIAATKYANSLIDMFYGEN